MDAYLTQTRTFDAATDPDRPQVGDVVQDEQGRSLRIKHVEACTATAMMRAVMAPQEEGIMSAALHEADDCIAREHATRPFVCWLCWVDEVKEQVIGG